MKDIQPTIVTIQPDEQVVVVSLGDGCPVVLHDDLSLVDLPDLIGNQLQRRVLATRLHYWADQLGALS
jgi:hypothetical protein